MLRLTHVTTPPVRLRAEALEPRVLLSAAYPTNYDQYLLELVNRARADPAAEAARFGIDLNEGLPPGTISTAPKQPLAMNPYILDAAQSHTQWMIDTDTFSHTGSGGSDPGTRMAAAGYSFTGSWGWGENIAMVQSSGPLPMTPNTAQLHQNLFVDSGIAGRGHRLNILDSDFREVGTAVLAGNWGGLNAVVCTEDFAYSGSSVFLTGVAYDDAAVQNDDFYTPGEGLNGVAIAATRVSDGALFNTSTWTSGGYSLALAAGTYNITASGGGLPGAVVVNGVVVGAQNVKLDFTPDQVTTAPDLVVSALTAPDGLAGATISVPTTVVNSGNAATGAGFTVSYYLSANASWDVGDTLLAATGNTRSALAAGGTDPFTAQVTLPVGVSGARYIVAYVDWNGTTGVIAESNEANNNTTSDPLTITLPAPDLRVTALTAPDGLAGATISVPTTVVNSGTASTGAGFTVSYYLSDNAAWDAGDTLLAATGNNRAALATGGTDSFTAQVTLPPGVSGAKYVVAYVDWNGTSGAIAESNEGNNTMSDGLTITLPVPDLCITTLTAPDALVGATISVPTTVTNSGTGTTGAGFTVSYYLSDNASWDAGDTLLAATGNTRAALAAGGTDSFTAQVTLPVGVSGSKYVVAYADWDGTSGAITESNEANNTASDPLTIAVPAPDLRISALTAPDALVGDTISVPTTAVNSGNISTGAGFTVSYYLSANSVWDAGDTLLAATGNTRPALGAGASDPFTAQVTLPPGVSGTKYIVAYVDWDGAAGAIAESNEANNTASDPLTISVPAPDLRISALTAPDALVGDTISVPTTALNSGNISTGAGFTVSYYLSANSVWDAGDTLLAAAGNDRPALGAGASDPFTAQVTLPPGVSGTKYIVAYADWDGAAGAIAESNEANNTMSDLLTISVPAADLRISALSAPDALVGDTISVPTTAVNSGNISTGAGFTVSYYLSADSVWDAGDTLLGATGNTRPALAAGASDPFTAQVTLPPGVSGAKYIVAYVDWDGAAGAIAESNEANNTAADPLNIAVPAADLRVTALSAPDGVAGTTISVPTTVMNSGNIPTGAGFTVSYYLSDNVAWDAGDTLLAATGNTRPALAAGGTDSFTAQVTLPAGVHGDKYIVAYVDWDGVTGAISESNETNNTASDPLFIVLLLQPPGPPDPSALLVGQPFAFDFASVCEGQPGAAYSLIAGPAWLTMDAATGLLAGTPTRRAHIAAGPVTIRVDNGQGTTEDLTFQLSVQGQVITLTAALPTPLTKATFTDASGDLVSVGAKGLGTFYLIRGVATGAANTTPADLVSIELEGTDARSALTFKVSSPTKAPLPSTSVRDIVVNGSFNLSAPALNLLGDMTVTGSAAKLTLGDVAAQHVLSIGSDPLIASASVVLGRVQDASLSSATPLKSLSVVDWLDTDATPDAITAPWISSLATRGSKIIGGPKGDFEASVTLSGAGATKGTLGKASIVGSVVGGTWNISGAAGSVAVRGNFTNCSFQADWLKSLSVAGRITEDNTDGDWDAIRVLNGVFSARDLSWSGSIPPDHWFDEGLGLGVRAYVG